MESRKFKLVLQEFINEYLHCNESKREAYTQVLWDSWKKNVKKDPNTAEHRQNTCVKICTNIANANEFISWSQILTQIGEFALQNKEQTSTCRLMLQGVRSAIVGYMQATYKEAYKEKIDSLIRDFGALENNIQALWKSNVKAENQLYQKRDNVLMELCYYEAKDSKTELLYVYTAYMESKIPRYPPTLDEIRYGGDQNTPFGFNEKFYNCYIQFLRDTKKDRKIEEYPNLKQLTTNMKVNFESFFLDPADNSESPSSVRARGSQNFESLLKEDSEVSSVSTANSNQSPTFFPKNMNDNSDLEKSGSSVKSQSLS